MIEYSVQSFKKYERMSEVLPPQYYELRYVGNYIQMIKTFILILAVTAISHSLQLAHELKEGHEGTVTLNLAALRKTELDKHNEYRAKHGVPPLTLSDSLNTAAQTYATGLYNTHGGLKHSSAAMSGKYGENLYWAWGYPKYTYPTAGASVSWYKESKDYNYATGASTNGKVVGHFTAMIWKSVTKVGFGFVQGDERSGFAIYVVANYSPAPNYAGQYVANVPSPKY